MEPPRGSVQTAALVLRGSGPEEAALLHTIQRDACLPAFGHIFPPERYPFPDDAVLDRWRTFVGRVHVAERNGSAVGLAATDDGWLHGLYVVPAEWGLGAASLLHDRAVVDLAAEGREEARLWVLEENGRARRFYERLGWVGNSDTRVVPFPPHPLDVGYSLSLARRAG